MVVAAVVGAYAAVDAAKNVVAVGLVWDCHVAKVGLRFVVAG